MKSEDGKYIGTVKVGAKGQIVIPKEIRETFSIKPGDMLIMLADPEHGIALERYSVFETVASKIFSGHAKEVYPERSEEDSLVFAKAIQSIKEEEDSDECNRNNSTDKEF